MSLSLRYAAQSHVGLLRDGNEDSGYAGPHLLAVADGMGGHVAGEVASGIAVSTAALQDTTAAPLPDGQDDALTQDLEPISEQAEAPPTSSSEASNDTPIQRATRARLQQVVNQANERIRERVNAEHTLRGMGTTLTLMLRVGDELGLAHVGDSRCYRLREGELEQLTTDHTFVQALVDEGRITASQAAVHPQRSLITRALDGREDVEPDISFHPLEQGDRYLLCSDGLSGVVGFSSLQEVLINEPNPHDACEELIARALEGGGPDNITCIVADVSSSRARKSPVQWAGAAQAGRHLSSASAAPAPLPAASPAAEPDEQLPAPESDLPTTARRGFVRGYLSRASQKPATPPEVGSPPPAPGPTPHTATTPDGAIPTVSSLYPGLSATPDLVEESSRSWPWWVLSGAFVLALLFLLSSLAYADSQRRFYIGVGDGVDTDEQVVAIYQGVNRHMPLMTLSHLNETSDLSLLALPPATRERVRSTIPARNAEEAQSIIKDLRRVAQLCQPWASSTSTPSTPSPNTLPTLGQSATPTGQTRPPECAGMGQQP